jgi:hypothetical protein
VRCVREIVTLTKNNQRQQVWKNTTLISTEKPEANLNNILSFNDYT